MIINFITERKHDFILKQTRNGGSITGPQIGRHLLSRTVFLRHILKIKENLVRQVLLVVAA